MSMILHSYDRHVVYHALCKLARPASRKATKKEFLFLEYRRPGERGMAGAVISLYPLHIPPV